MTLEVGNKDSAPPLLISFIILSPAKLKYKIKYLIKNVLIFGSINIYIIIWAIFGLLCWSWMRGGASLFPTSNVNLEIGLKWGQHSDMEISAFIVEILMRRSQPAQRQSHI